MIRDPSWKLDDSTADETALERYEYEPEVEAAVNVARNIIDFLSYLDRLGINLGEVVQKSQLDMEKFMIDPEWDLELELNELYIAANEIAEERNLSI